MSAVMFSVIVVCLNAEKTISRTLDSILGQTCGDYEIIIKDGKSKDHTLSMIPEGENIRVYSQADKSVYDAMNQAVDYAKGQFIIFMNCGDTFHGPDVLEKAMAVIQSQSLKGSEVLYGNYAKGGHIYTQCPQIGKTYLIRKGLCHQTVFFGREIFEKYGKFDDSMLICADYEIMVRAFFAGSKYIYVNEVICDYLGGGLSEQEKNIPMVKKEGSIVRKRYFSKVERYQYFFEKILQHTGRSKKQHK